MKGKASIGQNDWSSPMSKSSLMCVTAGLLCAFAASWPTLAAEGTKHEGAAIPNFAPDSGTAWTSDRPQSDDFLPPASGPGPVLSDKAHPYVPNGQGQPTYRVADLTNPILKPWVVEQMRKTNEDVLAGKVPFIARERCWPAGVPGLNIYNRGQPVHFIQTPKQVADHQRTLRADPPRISGRAAFGACEAVMVWRIGGALRRRRVGRRHHRAQ